MSSAPASNTSRAYWELKAEQVMDRVFFGAADPPRERWRTAEHSGEPIAVSIQDIAAEVPPGRRWGSASRPSQVLAWSLAAVGVVGCLALWRGWNETQQDLRSERNLRLLESVRTLASPRLDELPPPPPSEPWIEELQQLGSQPAHGMPPIQVPLPSTLKGFAELNHTVNPAAEAAFSLLGVMQMPGRAGSALIQVGAETTNVQVGESVLSTGWRLMVVEEQRAILERFGQRRALSLKTGF